MRRLRPSSEAQMVALFLRTELPAARHPDDLRALLEREGLPEHVITNPDLGDDAENQARLRISHVKRHTVQITACDGEMVAHSRRLPTLRLSMACLSSCGGDAYRLDLASGQGAGDRNTRRAGSAAWQWRIGCPAPGGMGTVAVTGAESSQESWPTWGGSVNGSGNPA